jgi:hypothetical protein
MRTRYPFPCLNPLRRRLGDAEMRIASKVHSILCAAGIAAVGFAMWRGSEVALARREAFLAHAKGHGDAEDFYRTRHIIKPDGSLVSYPHPALAAWHRSMRAKWERASRYPMLPVAPDTPAPQDALGVPENASITWSADSSPAPVRVPSGTR